MSFLYYRSNECIIVSKHFNAGVRIHLIKIEITFSEPNNEISGVSEQLQQVVRSQGIPLDYKPFNTLRSL